ncbi:MAG: DUF262 domain-containing protein [Kiritimatiellae bacterium]|nr:DUF262 domain-containing protein [Kiritimatiellia bacterium]
MNEMNDTLKSLSIDELTGQVFHIPWYQRGYRWTPTEVKRLLEDIEEYRLSETDSGYSLQPICVSKYNGLNNEWVVIDGQQRLTTIYLILQVGKGYMETFDKKGFSIKYDTRKDIDDFLTSLDASKTPEEVSENTEQAIERYYLQVALRTISEWFATRKNLPYFMQTFTASKREKKHVELIKYNTQATTEAENIRLFNRINSGKIPLTNAELIKALLLNVGSEEKQYQCAEEWNRIENELDDDEFWSFLYAGKSDYETRIDLLFSTFLDLNENSIDDAAGDKERLHIFYGMKAIVDSQNAEGERFELWNRVVEHYSRLREWYDNNDYFHRIGFLVQSGETLQELLKIQKNKNEFMLEVKQRIQNLIKAKWPKKKKELCELSYEEDKDIIRILLLLFNVESILKNPHSGYRFSFADYFHNEWDIEHIRSVNSNLPDNLEKQRKWFRCILQYYTGIDLDNCQDGAEDAVQKWLEKTCKLKQKRNEDAVDLVKRLAKCVFGTLDELQEDAETLYKVIIMKFNEKENLETRHDIGNLALLDAETNRSYQNAPFPVKRGRILQNNANGKFVPPCTLNAFLKYYSRIPLDVLIWTDEDSDDYRQAIEELLNEELDYLPYPSSNKQNPSPKEQGNLNR